MEPALDPLSHPTQGRNYTTSMPSRISAALFLDPAPFWRGGAGRESHIPAEVRKPVRGDVCCCSRGFQLALTDIPGLFTGQNNRQRGHGGAIIGQWEGSHFLCMCMFIHAHHETCFSYFSYFYAHADSTD